MYFITTIQFYDKTRCVGYVNSLEDAVEDVTNNTFDMHEGRNWYCVIEKMSAGIYPVALDEDQWWFRWNKREKKYKPCEKPRHLRNICNFCIG